MRPKGQKQGDLIDEMKILIALKGSRGLIKGMLWSTAVTRKYMLATRMNWSSMALGRKLIILYLEVRILLDGKRRLRSLRFKAIMRYSFVFILIIFLEKYKFS